MRGFTILALCTSAVALAGSEHSRPAAAYIDAATDAGLVFQFHNSATSRKYLIETMGGGVAIFDYDNDGWPDVFFVNGAALKDPQPDEDIIDKSAPQFWNRLFRNNRDGTFTDVTVQSGLQGKGYGMGVATGDYDNDGFTDLLVTTYGGAILYHNNGNGTFSDVTAAARIETTGWTTSAGFFDYDGDGCLDLLIVRYLEWDFKRGETFCGVEGPRGRSYCHPDRFRPASNYLFHNTCRGTFTDVSEPSGISAVKGNGLGLAFGDFDNDGRIDVYVANDAMPQMLFHNNGNGTFSDVATVAGVAYTEDGKTFSGMGTTFADIDGDGLPDIVTTALPYEYYALFRNMGSGQFQYDSVSSRLAALTRPYGGWGIHVFDYDNDGAPELFLANAHVMDNIEVTQPHLRTFEPPLLLKYTNRKFADISTAAGEVFKQSWAARGAAFGDLDNDGDIDIVVTDYRSPAHLLRNEGGNRNHWIGLDLRGTRSNRDAIGAKVRLTTTNGAVRYAMVSTAGSYLSANDRRVFFGLGQDSSVRDIEIHWPSGTVQVVNTAQADRIVKITEPEHTATTQKQFDAALALVRQGRNAEAIAALRDVIKHAPNMIEAHFSLGVLLAREGTQGYTEAMEQFLEVLRLNPSDVDAHINLSNLFEQEGDLPKSIAAMRRAVDLGGSRAELYVMLGEKQNRAFAYPDAAESFSRALASGPPLARAHYGLGLALRHLKRNEEATEQFQQALSMNPGDAYALFELGAINLEQNNPEKAAADLESAVHLKPDMAEGYLALSKAYRRLDRPEQAEAALRKAVQLKPDDVRSLYGLARISKAESGELFSKIRRLKASAAESAEAGGLNAEGIRFMQQGRLDAALKAFRQAAANDPGFATARYNIGVVLAHQGARTEAIEAFRDTIRLKPAFAEAHYALGLLLRLQRDPAADKELQTAEMLNAIH